MTNNLPAQTRDRYTEALAHGEVNFAQSIIDDAIERGATPPEIYLSVLAPAQVKLGEMWHRGEINVAQEHLATAITMQMMDRQRQAAKPRTPLGLRALVTPVKDDQHFVGARMTADFLIMDGWDVDFFWNATPDKDLAAYVQLRRIDLLAISVTMPEFLPNVAATAEAVRKLDPSKPKILLGGSAISNAEFEPRDLGVDVVVTDSSLDSRLARQLVGHTDTKPTLEQQLATIGKNIRITRNHRKLTQQQLAYSSGIDRTYISQVERGKQNLTIAAILKIANALDVSINELLGSRGID